MQIGIKIFFLQDIRPSIGNEGGNPYDIFEELMLSNDIEGLLCVTMCLLMIC